MQQFRALMASRGDAGPTIAWQELEASDLMEGDVTVRVSHSTINYKDALAITGKVPIIRRWPMIPGIDLAGKVVASSHADFQPGEEVLLNGWGLGETHFGGYAQLALLQKANALYAAGNIPEAVETYKQVAAKGDPVLAPVARIRAGRRNRYRVARHLDRLGRRAHLRAQVDLVVGLGDPRPQVLVEAGNQVWHQRGGRRYRQAGQAPADFLSLDLACVALGDVAVAGVVQDQP